MSAEDWMTRGYLAGFRGEPRQPPNFPVDAAAYEHGYRNGLVDRRPPAGPLDAAGLRAEAGRILAQDAEPLQSEVPHD